MTTKHTYLLIVLSFFLLTFSSPTEPCVKLIKVIPSYLNSWSDTEKREYQDCNDTSKYYIRMYEKDILTLEGNIINNQKEGVWKKYLDGNPWYEELYFHGKAIKVNSFDGHWTHFIINDSLSFETSYLKGKLQSNGLSINRLKIGIWEEIDSSGLKSYGQFTPEIVYDTISVIANEPPYVSYDTVFGYQRKDSTWFYFDEKNKLTKIEVYDHGKLIK